MNPSQVFKFLTAGAISLCPILPAAAQVLIDFDSLPAQPAATTYAQFSVANGGSATISGVNFASSDFYVVGDQYVEAFQNTGGSNPFIHPQSGHYGLFNAFGDDALPINTTQILTEIWFARADLGTGSSGPTAITVKALNGATVLGSASVNLADGTMTRLDTSSFSTLVGITGYEIDRTAGTGPYSGGLWVADSILFGAVPEPETTASMTGLILATFVVLRRLRAGLRR